MIHDNAIREITIIDSALGFSHANVKWNMPIMTL
jgi:hypothetical protein